MGSEMCIRDRFLGAVVGCQMRISFSRYGTLTPHAQLSIHKKHLGLVRPACSADRNAGGEQAFG